jgi:threonine dehydrogenase-like Zn-dependent dehydrogenase
VVMSPSGFCGLCRNCRIGLTHYCENSYTTGGDGSEVRPGSFAEYTRTGANLVFPKPKELSFDAGCQAEPVSGAWKGIIQYSEMKVGDDVVIIGTGGIGMYCLMVAAAAGAGRLIAVDTSDYALANAKKLGATHTVNPKSGDTKKAVYEIMPEGPDLVVEAAGPIQAVNLMTSMLRRGTRWNIFGITTHEEFKLDGGLMHFLEARMDSSFSTTPQAIERSIRMMSRGLVDPEKVISHRFPLTKIHEAIETMSSPERNKIIIHP